MLRVISCRAKIYGMIFQILFNIKRIVICIEGSGLYWNRKLIEETNGYRLKKRVH